MPTAGFLIYSGVMPLIKTFISIFCGYFLAKKDMFPAMASRGASQVTMNISLPALVFANIVPAFTPQNISALGPLFLTAFVYMIFGFVGGAIIREFCYVPRNFWQGIIVLSGMSNWGNLPNAVVLSVTQQAPFNPKTDPQLGVSFVSIFIVSYHLVFWVCGAAHSLSWDYLPGVPQGIEAERHCSWKEKPLGSFFTRFSHKPDTPAEDVDTPKIVEEIDVEKQQTKVIEGNAIDPIEPIEECQEVQLVHRVSRTSTITAPTVSPDTSSIHTPPSKPPSAFDIIRRSLRPLSAIITPVTLAIAIALPISLIQPLKALFVDVSSVGGPDWKGPDGKPPLAFIIDTASFVGNIAVPLALILLGAAFARLRVPRPLSRLPIMAMVSVALLKMVVLPVFGIFMVQAMVKGGLIAKESLAERFVAMFLSGTPAAVNQMIVASLYAPDGDVDTLSAFLLVQYIFMFFSSSAITAISLLLL